jgi:acetyl esterase
VPIDPQFDSYLAEAFSVHEIPVEDARVLVEAGSASMFGEPDPVGAVVDRALPGPVRVRIYEPPGDDRGRPVLVYFHGGGWVLGNLDTHDGVCRALCARTPCVVVSVDYRLAPEHRFPAAVDDAWAATAWVAEHARSLGGDPARIAVGGDSAGGTLAAVVALRARDHGLALRRQLLLYPVTDHSFDTRSYEENGAGCGLTREAMQWYWQQYLGPDAHVHGASPEASPLRAPSLADVAPAFVLTCEYDPLRDEGEAYAQRLEDAGVPVALRRYDGMIHGFLRMPAIVDRARGALDECAASLREAFA